MRNEWSQSEEVRRDAYGAMLPVVWDSDSEDAPAENIESCIERQKYAQRGILSLNSLSRGREKSSAGYAIRRDLKKWSDKVLQGMSSDENALDMDLIDAEQIDLGDECQFQSRKPTGLGAELMAYWFETVENEVTKRMAKVRGEWEDEMKLELEELKELRNQNQVLQQEIVEQKSQVNALTLRLHVLKSKQPKLDADRKDEARETTGMGVSISSSSMAAKQMLFDSQDDKDVDNEKNLLIDTLRRKVSTLECRMKNFQAEAQADGHRADQLEQQIEYMKVQHCQEVEDLQAQLSDLESMHESDVQELQEKLTEALRQAKLKASPEPASKGKKAGPGSKALNEATMEWKKERDSLKKEISRLRMKVEELMEECKEDTASFEDDQLQIEQSNSLSVGGQAASFDIISAHLNGIRAAVDIIGKSMEQFVVTAYTDQQGEETHLQGPIQHGVLRVGCAVMESISTYIQDLLQNCQGTAPDMAVSKEQEAVRSIAGMDLLTMVKSIHQEYMQQLTAPDEVDFVATTESDDNQPPVLQATSTENSPGKPLVAMTCKNDDVPVIDKCSQQKEEPLQALDSAPAAAQATTCQPDVEDVKDMSPSESPPGQGVQNVQCSKQVGWQDEEDCEIEDYPFDALTGLRTSSPEELSNWEQPAFFSISSYQRRARKQKEYARIDSSRLSRPVSAPCRDLAHLEKRSERWHRRNIRRIQQSRVITSTPQKGICLENSCIWRKKFRRRNAAQQGSFRIQTEIHPMRSLIAPMKGFLLQRVSPAAKKEMAARVARRTQELAQVLKEVQSAYEKACRDIEVAQSRQQDSAKVVQETRDLWLQGQADNRKLQEEVQELRRRLHDMTMAKI